MEFLHFDGLLIGMATFLIIGLFHPVVVKAEYYWGTRCWWLFLLLGIGGVAASLLVDCLLLSALCGVFAFSSFWTIKELFEQEERVHKGWFPRNPQRRYPWDQMACGLLCLWGLSGCIRAEAPNAEADILTCVVPGEVLKAEPEITNESVTLTVRADANITKLAPQFTLTEGATISPESGTTRDFSTPQTYVVTSEDRQWSKTYQVRCIVSGISTEYHFEQIAMEPTNGRYQIFYDILSNGDSISWASGNAGFALTNINLGVYDYPTMQDENGYKGKCAKLVTRSTGDFGSMLNMPMAAGNLFIGTFDVLSAIPDGRRASKMGRPFESVPTYLSGYYKYKAGDKFMAGGEEVKGKRDQCNVYAIFFETDDEVKYLDGFNFMTSPNLVSIAQISDQKETDEWTHFYIPFVMQPGKVIDKEKLAQGGYQLSIVFSSSIEGDVFNGAEGSTLWIDEVEIIHADNND